ncbi:MAG: hypothetical protein A2857_04480 [Candidatus Levybacteria bacterium RIFCSPHIGHO2_01_FULL_36_15]|nr:MAG: hypothetical protein A2857_04480 [Candidatus Levybacteria bacterium RIFCSPHIGHO2_01_FULL_36_15]
MATERTSPTPEAPKENFARGLLQVDMPEFGTPMRGKVRDSWIIDEQDPEFRVMVTTDRQSAYDSIVCTVPGKGQVLNLLSAYWFEQTQDVVPNHMIAVPHPNVLFARQAQATLPVEVVLRRYMARSSTTTSVYHNYSNRGRRNIYGIDFPEGLQPNQEFPMGTVLTPTTKADAGHDEELSDERALEIVDSKLGDGTWDKAKSAAYAIFERARTHCLDRGLILVDTKYEFGIDGDGNLMLIDEVHTPDSSRFWLAETYEEKFKEGKTPDTFDKEILRRWLAEKGFKGDGPIPKVDTAIIDAMAQAYTVPYRMITGQELPPQFLDTTQQVSSSNPDLIREAASRYVTAFIHGSS